MPSTMQASYTRWGTSSLYDRDPVTPARVVARWATHAHRRRPRLVVRSVEHSKWGEGYGLPDNGFDKETAEMVLRLLTVRAVQQVLVQLQEINQAQAQWLNHFAADNPPQDGNKFILKLFSQQGKDVIDPITRSSHSIDPQFLAHRVLQVREALANGMAGFPEYAKLESTSVLRSHLKATTYVLGSPERGQSSGYRRGQSRPPKGPPKP